MRMKKKMYVSGIVLAAILAFGADIYAATAEKVTLTEENELLFSEQGETLKTAWTGMAPGDTRTVALCLENKNHHKAAFYLSQETTDILEEKNKSAGGAYEYEITVGKTEESAKNILDTVAGGYSENLEASTTGLSDITQLNQFQYVAELAPGEDTNLYLTLTLDGEGMDSANGIDYSNADGELAFQFLAYYEENDRPVIVPGSKTPKTADGQNPGKIQSIVKAVKTGDVSEPAVLVFMFAGTVLFTIGIVRNHLERKKKAEGIYENSKNRKL